MQATRSDIWKRGFSSFRPISGLLYLTHERESNITIHFKLQLSYALSRLLRNSNCSPSRMCLVCLRNVGENNGKYVDISFDFGAG